MRAFTTVWFLCCFELFSSRCFSQKLTAVKEDSITQESGIIDYFNSVIAQQSEIYNGKEYRLSPPATKGTFYFQDKATLTPALIRYNGTWYKNVPLIYDVHQGEMISSIDNVLFAMVEEKLSDVYLSGHHFINLQKNDFQGNMLPGFYDLLYNGASKVLAKRTKLIEEHLIPPQSRETYYLDKSEFYIKKGTEYLQVSSKNNIVKIFSEQKKGIINYIDQNKLDFRKDPESAIIKVTAYYDQLSP